MKSWSSLKDAKFINLSIWFANCLSNLVRFRIIRVYKCYSWLSNPTLFSFLGNTFVLAVSTPCVICRAVLGQFIPKNAKLFRHVRPTKGPQLCKSIWTISKNPQMHMLSSHPSDCSWCKSKMRISGIDQISLWTTKKVNCIKFSKKWRSSLEWLNWFIETKISRFRYHRISALAHRSIIFKIF